MAFTRRAALYIYRYCIDSTAGRNISISIPNQSRRRNLGGTALSGIKDPPLLPSAFRGLHRSRSPGDDYSASSRWHSSTTPGSERFEKKTINKYRY